MKSALSKWLSKIDSVETKIATVKDHEKDQQACINELESEIRSETEKDNCPTRLLQEQLEQKLASQNWIIRAMEEAIFQHSILLKKEYPALLYSRRFTLQS